MKLGAAAHLTYCTNIHPGETWDEVRANLERHLPAGEARGSAPTRPFGVGLRLSAVAARDARPSPARWRSSRTSCAAQRLYVFTINGFPYGPFHGTRGEGGRLPAGLARRGAARVHEPARRPAGAAAAGRRRTRRQHQHGARGLSSAARGHRGGRGARSPSSCCATRPTWCQLERAPGGASCSRSSRSPAACSRPSTRPCAFFRAAPAFGGGGGAPRRTHRPRRGRRGRRRCGAISASASTSATPRSSSRIPRQCLRALAAAGIRIAKMQVTAGLRIPRVDRRDGRRAASARRRRLPAPGGRAQRGRPAPLRRPRRRARIAAAWRQRDSEWRVHFHVPVFLEALERLRHHAGVRPRGAGPAPAAQAVSPHLEVETYTWSVLPRNASAVRPVEEAIARELRGSSGNCLDEVVGRVRARPRLQPADGLDQHARRRRAGGRCGRRSRACRGSCSRCRSATWRACI